MKEPVKNIGFHSAKIVPNPAGGFMLYLYNNNGKEISNEQISQEDAEDFARTHANVTVMRSTTPYYDTMRQAIDAALRYAAKQGYEVVDDNVWWEAVPYETTVQKSLVLKKDGKEQRKMLHISFYRMPSGKYELTEYIN